MTGNRKTGFIGAGNMATALVSGLLQSGACEKEVLGVSDTSQEALNRISDRFGLTCYSSNRELVKDCSTVVLCVKPQNMVEVLDGVKGEIQEGHLLISIAAGIPLGKIQATIGRDVNVIMPEPTIDGTECREDPRPGIVTSFEKLFAVLICNLSKLL